MKPLKPNIDGQVVTQLQSIASTLIDPPTCTVVRPSNQSIADVTDVDIDFTSGATVEEDTHSMFSTGASDRITIARAGWYLFSYCVQFAADATGLRSIWVTVGGTTYGKDTRASFAGTCNLANSTQVDCAASAIVQLWVRQSSGGALNAVTQDFSPRLSATWLRS